MEPDFSGYATKAGILCTDGRTIMPNAFEHQDTDQVPLVWMHGHKDPENVLGYAILHNRTAEHAEGAGVYAEGYFNETPKAQATKLIVQHGDVKFMSIWANSLVERAKQVFHGAIKEVSLVLAGANSGARIDYVRIAHSEFPEDDEISTDEAIIYSDSEITVLSHADGDDKTAKDVYDSLSEEQKELVHFMIGEAIKAQEGTAEHGNQPAAGTEIEHTEKEGTDMTKTRNLFEQNGELEHNGMGSTHVLTHDGLRGIVKDAIQRGSFKAALQHYADEHLEHGVNDIEILFPEAQLVDRTPQMDMRRMEWVDGVLGSTKKLPYSRIKTLWTEGLTLDAARALGYIKGNLKKEEFFGLATRKTGPATMYKKQKIDRDDIIDITEFDFVAWLWTEIRMLFLEELARAILIGDGRPEEDPLNPGEPNPDKIKDPMGASSGDGIRSILNDHELFVATAFVPMPTTRDGWMDVVDAGIESSGLYKGTGTPTLYTTRKWVTKMLLVRDSDQKKMYRTRQELASEFGVDRIVEVEVMETVPEIFGIIVNLSDYSIGTDRGGELAKFDDFDIDYNQYKYLMESRLSGALTKIRSAIILRFAEAGATLRVPTAPEFDSETSEVTVPTITGVTYKDADTDATLTTGSPVELDEGEVLHVVAIPAASSDYFADNQGDEWTFTGVEHV